MQTLGEFEMSGNKPSSKQSGPTTRYGRQIAYDFEIAITICRRLLLGEDLREICAKPPMPIGLVFSGGVQDHPEARAIYRSVDNFRMDRGLAREVGDMPASIAEWEERVRANCERGWPAGYLLLGGPPVWSTEDIEAYTEMLYGFTEMLEPRDPIELTCTKEAADATWEAARMAREKNGLPEHKYQERLEVLAQLPRQRGAAESTAAKPATAFDHSLGLQAGCKYYQAFDIAESRAIKRRDNALRQIARWRDGLGAKARRLSDKFISGQGLAERYGATELLANAEADAIARDSVQAAPPLASVGEAADAAPPIRLADEAAGAAPSLGSAAEAAEAEPPLRNSDEAVAPPLAPAAEAAEAAPARACQGAEPL
jgi:hypothetical protein